MIMTVEVRKCNFLLSLMLVHVSSRCIQRHATYHLKGHRLSNNMVLKLPVYSYENCYGDLKFDLKNRLLVGFDIYFPIVLGRFTI